MALSVGLHLFEMTANSPTAFYLLEILKVAWAVAPVGLILFATFLAPPQALGRALFWLRLVTAVWLVVMLLSRTAMSSPITHHYLSGTFPSSEAAARQTDLYLAAANGLWLAEQTMFAIFSVALFFVLRAAWRSKSSPR